MEGEARRGVKGKVVEELITLREEDFQETKGERCDSEVPERESKGRGIRWVEAHAKEKKGSLRRGGGEQRGE